MIKPLAPRFPRGCSLVGTALLVFSACTGGFSSDAFAQGADKKADAPKEKAEEAKQAPDVQAASKRTSTVQILKDPIAEEMISIQALKPSGWRELKNQSDLNVVRAMAAGETAVDRDTLQRFVQAMGSRLTDKTNVQAWLDSAQNPRKALEIQKATALLLELLNVAKASKNTAFLSAYNAVLIANLPKLLDNHLLPRTEAIIVLAQTESPDAVPIFIAQLKNPKQTVWVKLWSAQGLSNVAGGGKRVDSTLPGSKAIDAAKALADLLEKHGDAPWPVLWRSVEALGAMRQAATPGALQKAEMASAAMKLLADPDANIRVRATAAWALGMLRVNTQTAKYNYLLVAHEIGSLAAEFGEKVNSEILKPAPKKKPASKKPATKGKVKEKEKEEATESDEKDSPEPTGNKVLAELYAGLLAKDLYQAFQGMEGANDSGLAKVPATQLGTAAPIIKQIADLQTGIMKASIELVSSGPGQIEDRKKDLADRVAAMQQYLAKNSPKDYWLVPGGAVFHVPNAPAAEATAPAAKPSDGKPKPPPGVPGDR